MSFIKHQKTGNLIFTIQAKEGGQDAKNFAYILFKMYTLFLKNKNIKFEIIVKNEVGVEQISSVSIKIINSLILLKENGIYKLIRKSPFDSNFKRHTSFCEIIVSEETTFNFQLNLNECKIDTFRASGKGGQNVNKVETAVRVTHLPSNLVVVCQDNRDQLSNKQAALAELERRLKALAGEKETNQQNMEIVKTFVFDPNKYIKLHKKDLKINKVDSILNGELDIFIN